MTAGLEGPTAFVVALWVGEARFHSFCGGWGGAGCSVCASQVIADDEGGLSSTFCGSLVWAYALIWFLINDRIKLLAYRVLDPVKKAKRIRQPAHHLTPTSA